MKHSLNKCHVNCVLWILMQSREWVGLDMGHSQVQFLSAVLVSVCSLYTEVPCCTKGGTAMKRVLLGLLRRFKKIKHLAWLIALREPRHASPNPQKIQFSTLIGHMTLAGLFTSPSLFLHLSRGDNYLLTRLVILPEGWMRECLWRA